MRLLESLAIGLIVLLGVMIAVFGRREYFARHHGAVELYWRLRRRVPDRGWAPGFARFCGNDLRWYRMFSLAFRPRRTLSRRTFTVRSRRAPTAEEAALVPADWIVLSCVGGGITVEIAMPSRTVPGFLSWLESIKPYST